MQITPMEKAQAAELLGMSSRSDVIAIAGRISDLRKITAPTRYSSAAVMVKQFLKRPDPVLWTEVAPAERDLFLAALDK